MNRKLFFKINLISLPLTYLIFWAFSQPTFGGVYTSRGYPFVYQIVYNELTIKQMFSPLALIADVLFWYIIFTLIIYGLYLIKTKLFSKSKNT